MGLSNEDRKLVEASVAHWVRMRDDPVCREMPGGRDCALCQTYRDNCLCCPVARGNPHSNTCIGTPWAEAASFWGKCFGDPQHIATPDERKAWEMLADMEVEFLKSLLD